MTTRKAEVSHLSAKPVSTPTDALLERMFAQHDNLVDRLQSTVSSESGTYRAMIADEIGVMVSHNLPVVLRCLRDRTNYSERDLQPVRDSAARMATAGVPQEILLRALNSAAASLLNSTWREATLRERASLLGLVTHGLALSATITVTISEAYDEHRPPVGHIGAVRARTSLVRALLAGAAVDEVATRAGVKLADSYAVLLLLAPSCRSNGWPNLPEREFEALFPAGSLCLATPDGATVLTPVEVTDVPYDFAPVRTALNKLAGRLGGPVVAASSWRVTRRSIPDAAAEARRVLDFVRHRSGASGLYVLDDVLLEYALSDAPDVRRRLAAILGPIRDNAGLLDALGAYLAMDCDRRHAAALLHIHPTTLDYRLRQIAVRTGLSPASPRHLMTLRMALTAGAIDRDDGSNSPSS